MSEQVVEDQAEYLHKLIRLLEQCFEDVGQHAVLVVGNDNTRIMGMYAVNADQNEVGSLVTAAAAYCIEDARSPERVLN